MTPPRLKTLSRRFALTGVAAATLAVTLGACTPTIRLKVDPIQINATLDANVRIQLDKELQDLLRQNPNLF